MSTCLQEDNEEDETNEAFPRLESRPSASASGYPSGDGDILLKVHQRRAGEHQTSYEVITGADGTSEIPMEVSATTVGAWLPREVLLRSPWLARCLDTPEGSTVVRPLMGAEDDLDADLLGSSDGGLGTTCGTALTCNHVAACVLELGLPARGAGHILLGSSAIRQCLDLCAPNALPFEAAGLPTATLLTYFLWAVVLEMDGIARTCRDALIEVVDASSVVLALAAGHASSDAGLLQACYWCLRDVMCGATGVPAAWLDGRGPVRLSKGILSYKGTCQVPLHILRDFPQQDSAVKRQKWLTPTDGYTLCQVHRKRGEEGCYPHMYEMRLDHSDEVVCTALREDEQSAVSIFALDTASTSSSDHCDEFLGAVVPNFWGTQFTLYDSGTDVDALCRRSPASKDLPMRRRVELCKIGYETNILGDCPRKVTVDFERMGEQYHMENLGPRWDKKLNSYALPFFGRVKKASAKNFQLVVGNDANTIYLMFGKISKDVFCLDFRSPLTTLDAMAIAIAALAKKRAVS